MMTRRQGFGLHQRRRPESSARAFPARVGTTDVLSISASSRARSDLLVTEESLRVTRRARDYFNTAPGHSAVTRQGCRVPRARRHRARGSRWDTRRVVEPRAGKTRLIAVGTVGQRTTPKTRLRGRYGARRRHRRTTCRPGSRGVGTVWTPARDDGISRRRAVSNIEAPAPPQSWSPSCVSSYPSARGIPLGRPLDSPGWIYGNLDSPTRAPSLG